MGHHSQNQPPPLPAVEWSCRVCSAKCGAAVREMQERQVRCIPRTVEYKKPFTRQQSWFSSTEIDVKTNWNIATYLEVPDEACCRQWCKCKPDKSEATKEAILWQICKEKRSKDMDKQYTCRQRKDLINSDTLSASQQAHDRMLLYTKENNV